MGHVRTWGKRCRERKLNIGSPREQQGHYCGRQGESRQQSAGRPGHKALRVAVRSLAFTMTEIGTPPGGLSRKDSQRDSLVNGLAEGGPGRETIGN